MVALKAHPFPWGRGEGGEREKGKEDERKFQTVMHAVKKKSNQVIE